MFYRSYPEKNCSLAGYAVSTFFFYVSVEVSDKVAWLRPSANSKKQQDLVSLEFQKEILFSDSLESTFLVQNSPMSAHVRAGYCGSGFNSPLIESKMSSNHLVQSSSVPETCAGGHGAPKLSVDWLFKVISFNTGFLEVSLLFPKLKPDSPRKCRSTLFRIGECIVLIMYALTSLSSDYQSRSS